MRLGAPPEVNGMGINTVGPVLMHYGTEEQKTRYMANILSADEIWCQGFSEPGSGSDLASLSTAPSRTAMSLSSPARKSGPVTPTTPSGVCSSPGPIQKRPSTRALVAYWWI